MMMEMNQQSILNSTVAEVGTPAPNSTGPVNLYVSGLPTDVTEDVLLAHFAPFGFIQSASIMRSTAGVSQNRRVGFVLYSEEAAASKALMQMNGTTIGQCIITVRRARLPSSTPVATSTSSNVSSIKLQYNQAQDGQDQSNAILSSGATTGAMMMPPPPSYNHSLPQPQFQAQPQPQIPVAAMSQPLAMGPQGPLGLAPNAPITPTVVPHTAHHAAAPGLGPQVVLVQTSAPSTPSSTPPGPSVALPPTWNPVPSPQPPSMAMVALAQPQPVAPTPTPNYPATLSTNFIPLPGAAPTSTPSPTMPQPQSQTPTMMIAPGSFVMCHPNPLLGQPGGQEQ